MSGGMVQLSGLAAPQLYTTIYEDCKSSSLPPTVSAECTHQWSRWELYADATAIPAHTWQSRGCQLCGFTVTQCVASHLLPQLRAATVPPGPQAQ